MPAYVLSRRESDVLAAIFQNSCEQQYKPAVSTRHTLGVLTSTPKSAQSAYAAVELAWQHVHPGTQTASIDNLSSRTLTVMSLFCRTT
jgi:hypothetical protein